MHRADTDCKMVDSSPQFQQSVRVSLLFEGKKLFRLQKKCISFVLIEHKIIGSLDPISPIIEVVAYSHPNEEDISTVFEAPRLYLSSHKIFRKLDDADLHVGGLIVTEDTQFAATLIAKYIYGRIVISTKPFRPGSEQIIEIEIIPLESDVNSSDFSSGTYDIFHDGIRILGQLPPINNIRYVTCNTVSEKMNQRICISVITSGKNSDSIIYRRSCDATPIIEFP